MAFPHTWVDFSGPALSAEAMEEIEAEIETKATIASVALKAPLASPTFTGSVTLPAGTVTAAMVASDVATQAELDAHVNDTTAAHVATAIAFTPAGTIAATTVQAAIEEVAAEAGGGGGGAPTDATYLTTVAHAGLSAEVVVGATPGGELGGTWASPTVDTVHSGSAHADFVPKSILDANTVLMATVDDTPAALAMGPSTILVRLASGNIVAGTPAQLKTLLAIGEADVTGLTADLALKAPVTEAVNTVATSGAAQTIPAPGTQSISRITLTANCTLTFPTAAAGASFTLVLVEDGTGSRTVTWPGTVKWAGGTAPTLSTGAGKIDYLSFVCTDGTNWAGFVSGLDMR